MHAIEHMTNMADSATWYVLWLGDLGSCVEGNKAHRYFSLSRDAVSYFAAGQDMFVLLPTGTGKVIYAILFFPLSMTTISVRWWSRWSVTISVPLKSV